MNYELETLIIEIISLLFILIGGIFAFKQWRISLKYKRNEIVKPLVEYVRGNVTIAMIMNIIDWEKDIFYDGEFHIMNSSKNEYLKKISDAELFNKIDETLSIFSYICYLKKVGSLKKEDMLFFDYELSRICNNIHIVNYLYSLHHWSNSINVSMSFCYLVKYCIKKKFLDKSFKDIDSEIYYCFLDLHR